MSKALIPKFRGEINSQAHFVPHDKVRLGKYLSGLIGKRVTLIVEPEKRSRSLNQNAYYWAVVVKMIADETGHDSEEVHDILKARFLRKHVVFKGKPTVVVRSTASLKSAEFEEYVEACRRFATTELNLVVPLPGEVAIEI